MLPKYCTDSPKCRNQSIRRLADSTQVRTRAAAKEIKDQTTKISKEAIKAANTVKQVFQTGKKASKSAIDNAKKILTKDKVSQGMKATSKGTKAISTGAKVASKGIKSLANGMEKASEKMNEWGEKIKKK